MRNKNGKETSSPESKDSKPSRRWIVDNKELVTLAGVFLTALAFLVTVANSMISNITSRHQQETQVLRSQNDDLRAQLSAAEERARRAEDTKQRDLLECLNELTAKDARRHEELYAEYLQEQIMILRSKKK